MRTLTSVFCFLGIAVAQTVCGQNNDNLMKALTRPVVDCEIVAFNSQDIISRLDLSQRDSINRILDVWQTYCGPSEPLIRVKILLAISDKSFREADYTVDYYKFGIDRFHDRRSAVKSENPQALYTADKAAYDYVPLNASFDKWSEQQATALLPGTMPGSAEYLLCTLISGNVSTYDKEVTLKSTTTLKKYESKSLPDRPMVGVHIGVWQPVGNFNKLYETSAYFGFVVGLPVAKKLRVDADFSFISFSTASRFDYQANGSTYSAKSGGIFLVSISVVKTLDISAAWCIDGGIGAGIATLSTDVKRLANKSAYTTYYNAITAQVPIGITVYRKFKGGSQLGLKGQYLYTPFSLNHRVLTPLGPSSYVLGLTWRFGD